MNVASLERCKELHELSGWGHDPNKNAFWWMYFEPTPAKYHEPEYRLKYKTKGDYWEHVPAYDLGYLLRKLPTFSTISKLPEQQLTGSSLGYSAFIDNGYAVIQEYDNTPENAACKLAIKLFKQGILKKEECSE